MIEGSDRWPIIGFNPFDWLLFVYCGPTRLGSSTHIPERPAGHNYICCRADPSLFCLAFAIPSVVPIVFFSFSTPPFLIFLTPRPLTTVKPVTGFFFVCPVLWLQSWTKSYFKAVRSADVLANRLCFDAVAVRDSDTRAVNMKFNGYTAFFQRSYIVSNVNIPARTDMLHFLWSRCLESPDFASEIDGHECQSTCWILSLYFHQFSLDGQTRQGRTT